MGRRSIDSQLADLRIVNVITETPRTAREIEDLLRQEVFDTWAEDQGLSIAWGESEEMVGARIMAISTASDRGLVHVGVGSAYRRLLRLEGEGRVERIAPPGGRGILWWARG